MSNKDENNQKKVFISYSWTDDDYIDRIRNIATALREKYGIDTILDQWDLKPGDDKTVFMEQMVSDPDVDYVLLFSDKEYTEKANRRSKGVGAEAQIVTSEIYDNVKDSKFIPIVMERNEDGNEYLPTFVKARFFIDFTSGKAEYEVLEELARLIYNKPARKKPELGKIPNFEDRKSTHLLELQLQSLDDSKISSRMQMNRLQNNFFPVLIKILDDYNISIDSLEVAKDSQTEKSELLYKKIMQAKPLVNIFCEAMNIYLSNEHPQLDIVIEFFDTLLHKIKEEEMNDLIRGEFLTFILHESFLVTISNLLEMNDFDGINKLIYSEFKNSYGNTVYCTAFYSYLENLEMYNKKQPQRKKSLRGAMIKNRYNKQQFERLMRADLLLYYISKMNPYFQGGLNGSWYPVTHIYADPFFNSSFTFRKISNLKFKSNYEEMKQLFNLNVQEFKKSLEDFEIDREGFDAIPTIKLFIKPEEFVTL